MYLCNELTVDALNMCSLSKYLCRKSRTGIVDRDAQVAAKTTAPAEVMFGIYLSWSDTCSLIIMIDLSTYMILLSIFLLTIFVLGYKAEVELVFYLSVTTDFHWVRLTLSLRRVHNSGIVSFLEKI